MWPVTDAFRTKVRGSHVRTTTATLLAPDGSTLLTLYPNRDASVSVDGRRDVRRTCTDLTLATGVGGVDLIPDDATDPLSPLTDNEVSIRSGITLSDGTVEWVPLGVFGFTEARFVENSNGITVSLMDLADRSRLVTRSRWRVPYTIPSGTDLATAITAALDVCWPAHPRLDARSTATINALATFTEGPDSDPWRDLCGLAAAHGMELFFDAVGVPVLRDLPAPSSDNLDATYGDGDDAVVLDLTRSLSIAEGSYNGLVVTGESTSGAAPVRSVLWQNDYGPGMTTTVPARPRPAWFTSPLITTLAQADATCRARYLGAQELLSWTQVVNPAHDVWDLVRVERDRIKASADVVFDSVTIPLGAQSPMTVVGRSRAVWTGVS